MSTVAAYVPDLMDRSKVSAAVPDATIVSRPEMLVGIGTDVVVVDLTRPGVLDLLPQLTGRIIGFANHTQRDLMDAARAAGCHEVMARSTFFAAVREHLSP